MPARRRSLVTPVSPCALCDGGPPVQHWAWCAPDGLGCVPGPEGGYLAGRAAVYCGLRDAQAGPVGVFELFNRKLLAMEEELGLLDVPGLFQRESYVGVGFRDPLEYPCKPGVGELLWMLGPAFGGLCCVAAYEACPGANCGGNRGADGHGLANVLRQRCFSLSSAARAGESPGLLVPGVEAGE